MEILLHRRCNTGYLDGMYDFVGGHVEKNESLKMAMIRESNEEIGITLKKEDLAFVSLMHLYKDNYIYVFFEANKFIGNPSIKEPKKCDDLKWFNINSLPQNVAKHVKEVINNIKNKIYYEE